MRTLWAPDSDMQDIILTNGLQHADVATLVCVKAGASRIFAIDINPSKFEAATKWGATDCINPKDYDKPIQQVIVEMTEWGCDYTFECIGSTQVCSSCVCAASQLKTK